MSNDQIIAYLQAIRRREEAKKRFTEMAETVNEVGKWMTEELKSVTSGNPRVHHFHGYGMNGGLVEPQKWPSADAIARARQEMLSAAADAQNLWDHIPQEQRHGLLPPNAAQVHGYRPESPRGNDKRPRTPLRRTGVSVRRAPLTECLCTPSFPSPPRSSNSQASTLGRGPGDLGRHPLFDGCPDRATQPLTARSGLTRLVGVPA